MAGFWIGAGVMLAAVAGVLLAAVGRAGRTDGTDRVADGSADLDVYRAQMREIDRDLLRGVILEAEAEALRAEIGRRMLEADRIALRRAGDDPADRGAGRGWALVGVLVVIAALLGGVGLGLYRHVGAPGLADAPLRDRLAAADARLATRMPQAEAEAAFAASGNAPPRPELTEEEAGLLAQLREVVAANPERLDGQRLLVRHSLQILDFATARRAQEAVIALLGPAAAVGDYAALVEIMVMAAGGQVSPEADAAVAEILRRDPENGFGRFFSGLALAQGGRDDLAFPLWERLLRESGPADPWYEAIRTQIEAMAWRAGQHRYTLPEAPAGPTEADIAAAAAMSEEERMEMVRGMVEGLNARLAAEGGPAEEWAQLIRAYGILGNPEAAAAIWREALTRFEGREADLALIGAAAEAAGVGP